MDRFSSLKHKVLNKLDRLSNLNIALSTWVTIFSVYILLAWNKGVWTTRDAALTWWNSVDASIPELTARWMAGFGTFLEGWSPFDRGPLQPMFLLFTGSIWMGPEVTYFIGVLLNCFWSVGLFYLLRSISIDKFACITTVFAVALVGPVWINTVYPWPKMLSAGLVLLSFALLFFSKVTWSIVSVSLALLAHGSSIFAFVALFVIAALHLRQLKVLLYLIALIPASLWNVAGSLLPQFGDMRLTQWHFAGTDITEPDIRNPMISVIYQYMNSGFNVIGFKINNILATFGVLNPQNSSGTPSWWDGTFLNQFRAMQLMSVLLAPGALLIGLVNAFRIHKTLWLITVSLWLSYVLLEWGGDILATSWLHTAPLALLVVFSASLAIALKWWIVIPIQVIYFFGIWYTAAPVTQ